jgi:glutamate/tyrosine decarboxylase-like PLP-dependent enzyme
MAVRLTLGAWRTASSSADFELLSPASLGIVCFRFRPEGSALPAHELEALNRGIQDRIVRGGVAMMSSTRLDGRYSLRLCIMNPASRWDDVRFVLESIAAHGRELTSAQS